MKKMKKTILGLLVASCLLLLIGCSSVPKTPQDLSPLCLVTINQYKDIDWYNPVVNETYKGEKALPDLLDKVLEKEVYDQYDVTQPEWAQIADKVIYDALTETGFTYIPKSEVINSKTYGKAYEVLSDDYYTPEGYKALSWRPINVKQKNVLLDAINHREEYRKKLQKDTKAKYFAYVYVYCYKTVPILKETRNLDGKVFQPTPMRARVKVTTIIVNEVGEKIKSSSAWVTSDEAVPFEKKHPDDRKYNAYDDIEYDHDVLMSIFPTLIQKCVISSTGCIINE